MKKLFLIGLLSLITLGTKAQAYQEQIWLSNGEDVSYIAGNVGINTTSPSTALEVVGTITATNISISGLTSDRITFSTGTAASASGMRFEDNSNALIAHFDTESININGLLSQDGNTNNGANIGTFINLGHSSTAGSTVVDENYCTISGGYNHIASSSYATVGGGEENEASATYSTIAGGNDNAISGLSSFIGGGAENEITGEYSGVASGHGCLISGDYSGVLSGWRNSISGNYSGMSGASSSVDSDYSFLYGRNMNLLESATCSFVFGYESSDQFFGTPDVFLIYPTGGFVGAGSLGINVSTPTANLHVVGTSSFTAAAQFTGNVNSDGSITAGTSLVIGSTDIDETDLEKLNGITDGTAAANKALVVDSSIDIAGIRNLTITGNMGVVGTFESTGTITAGGSSAITFSGDTPTINGGTALTINISSTIVTNLQVNEKLIFGYDESYQALEVSSQIIVTHSYHIIESSGGVVTSSGVNPQIIDGTAGVITPITFVGNSDTNRFVFIDGSGLQLEGGVSADLGKGDKLILEYIPPHDLWTERGRSDN